MSIQSGCFEPHRVFRQHSGPVVSIEKSSSRGPALGSTVVKSDGVQTTSGPNFRIKPERRLFVNYQVAEFRGHAYNCLTFIQDSVW